MLGSRTILKIAIISDRRTDTEWTPKVSLFALLFSDDASSFHVKISRRPLLLLATKNSQANSVFFSPLCHLPPWCLTLIDDTWELHQCRLLLKKKYTPLPFSKYICHSFPLTDFSYLKEGGEAATNNMFQFFFRKKQFCSTPNSMENKSISK